MSWKIRLFYKPKSFINCPQKQHFFANQTLSVWTSLSLLPSQTTLFHHKRRKFAPSHNLLFVKNTAILLSSALNPLAVTPERRTDSKPFRRRFARKTGFGSCRRKTLLKSTSIELWIAGRRTESRVLFGYFLHNAKSEKPFPSQGDSRFCKPRISAHKRQIRTNKIKSFWNFRGFPNLDSARRNSGFAEANLNPLPYFF